MLSLLVSLVIVAGFAGLVYVFAPAPGERWGRMLERYRPHAPMSDWSVAEYDAARQYSDLTAVRARLESPDPDRRAESRGAKPHPFAHLDEIPCRGESVQF
ncbi:hypothetical protein ACIP5Y_45370 [Nocardia sp. NPDC088792]|uniref:hypothetical protein n=1 Tax=Nocardia sp. NPDC088792 TaxID=3364332 RepID=UPI003805D7B5